MRDPVLYRIRRAHHHRTGDAWCIYPMYDFAHPLSDALERITHSLCTLEFEDHRPLYDWLIEHLPVPSQPQQIEFARLNLTYTVMSKRKLLRARARSGTSRAGTTRACRRSSGMRRRGYTPEAIRDFCDRIGVAKRENMVDVALLEHAVREDLNRRAPRVMARARAAAGRDRELSRRARSKSSRSRTTPRTLPPARRRVPFSRELYIERDDFREEPPKKFFRLAPGREVRLRYAYFITCTGVVKDGDRRDRRAALHLRSGDARRRRARRPQGEGDAALGLGGARRRRRGAALRSAVHERESRRRCDRLSRGRSTRSRSRC